MREINRKLKVNKIKGKMPLVHRMDTDFPEWFCDMQDRIDAMREKVQDCSFTVSRF